MRTLVIADIGSTHENDIRQATDSIHLLAGAGVDAVKFQFWSSSKRLAERRKMPEAEAKYEAYRLPAEWLPKLKANCDDNGVEFMCSTFMPEDIAVVDPYVTRFKVSAFESNDIHFLSAHWQYKKQVIVSLNPGKGYPWLGFDWLHCVSKYPTPLEELQLRHVRYLRGFSDHSGHTLAGAYAVAAGATIVEVHFRGSHTPAHNPDYPHSLDPVSIMAYIQYIREVERML